MTKGNISMLVSFYGLFRETSYVLFLVLTFSFTLAYTSSSFG